MKIALLWPDYWPYIRRGTERMVHDIAQHLVATGHHVDVLASKPGPEGRTSDGALTVYRFAQPLHPVVRHYTLKLGRPLYRFDWHGVSVVPTLLRERYDVIHAFTYSYWPGLRLAKARGASIVYHVVMIPPYWSGTFDRKLVSLCFGLGGAIRVFSDYCGRYLEQHFGVEAAVVPPTVDTNVFRPVAARDVGRPKILYTADLVQPPKGPHVLALAFNHVYRARRDVVLQLAGPVGFDPNGVKRILELVAPEARGSVEVLGPGRLADLPRRYSEATVTVLPSLGEPFGMVLTESLACGTPVVGTNSGAIPEIVDDPRIGLLFERDDRDLGRSARDLGRALLRAIDLAENEGTRARCIAHARRWTWAERAADFDRLQTREFEPERARQRRLA